MRINELIGSSYGVISPQEFSNPNDRVVSLDSFYIANDSNTTTSVNVCLVDKDGTAAEGPGGNRFVIDFEIPAGDTLDVLEGGEMTLEGGETLQAKADAADLLTSNITYNVKARL